MTKLSETLTANRLAVFKNVIIGKKTRPELDLETIYVTPEEREKATALNKLKKADKVNKIEQMLSQLEEGLLKEGMKAKHEGFKKKLTSTKKDVFISLHEEVVSNMKTLDTNEREEDES